MRCEFRVQTRTQAPEAVRIVLLDCELLAQLAIDRLNYLPEALHQTTKHLWQLRSLIDTPCRNQAYATPLQHLGQLRLNIAFIAQKGPSLLQWQQIGGNLSFIGSRR